MYKMILALALVLVMASPAYASGNGEFGKPPAPQISCVYNAKKNAYMPASGSPSAIAYDSTFCLKIKGKLQPVINKIYSYLP